MDDRDVGPSALRSRLLDLLEWVLPSPCLACARPIRAWRPHLGLCVPCRGQLRPLETACAQCGEPLAGAHIPPAYRCGRCRLDPPAFDRLLACWSYEAPLDAVVRELKFSRLFYLATHLGTELARRFGPALATVDQIVPVPLHWRRQIGRGYNQSGEIARALGRSTGLPVRTALRRRRGTTAQTSLPRNQRRHNLRGAFRVRRSVELTGASVALIDDVMTTGTTLERCSRALREAGARTVVGVVAARTPPRAGRNLEGPGDQRSDLCSSRNQPDASPATRPD